MSLLIGERDRDADRERERDPIFRIRERRWLDSALRDDSLSRLDKDRQDGLLDDGKKTSKPPSTPLVFGEDLQYWVDKVCVIGIFESICCVKKHLDKVLCVIHVIDNLCSKPL